MKITIPQACSQSWSDMRPVDQGRHCAQCDRQILDFSQSSDHDLKKAFRMGQLHCGRFTPHQLNRPLTSTTPNPINQLQALVLSSSLTLAAPLVAQEKPGVEYQQMASPSSGWNMEHAEFAVGAQAPQPRELKGTVICAASGESVPFAIVFIPELRIGCSTDLDGKFCLAVQEADYGKDYRIEISFVGYETLVLEDAPLSVLHDNTFKMIEDTSTVYATAILGMIAVEDLSWRDRLSFFYWKQYYRMRHWLRGE